MTPPLTKSQQTNNDITSLLRARNALLWIATNEEQRVERAIVDAAAEAQYPVIFWDCAQGFVDSADKSIQNIQDPSAALGYIKQTQKRAVYVLRDLHKWWDPFVLRNLRNLARTLPAVGRGEARCVVVLTPSGDVPAELTGHATVLNYPIPERSEIAALLDILLDGLPSERREAAAMTEDERSKAIDAAVGLTAEEASNCYARSLVTEKRINPAVVTAEKKRVIAREKVLTWHDPDPRGLDAVGGLDVLKGWLNQRYTAFSPAARAFGLPAPKGLFLVGLPGTGKSLTAKCVATAWQVPLLRLDMGALKSKYVGESEANIRKALQVAEAVSPCVLWLDEIEKALAGSTGEQGDGGVSADALGSILSWMQERSGSVFVVATANDVRALPPELLRKGRFDEVFFTDLPTTDERKQVFAASLARYSRTTDGIDTDALAVATEGFTGAEIDAVVPDALFAAFNDGARAISTADLIAASKTVTPLAQTAKEKIEALRAWAKGRARRASSVQEVASANGRQIDLD